MANLNELISKGESDTIEFKEYFNREVIITAGAFANTRGGAILIGVSDSGEIKGVDIGKETLREWANQISQSTEPRVIPEVELEEADRKKVVVITIKEFPIKPVSVRGRCYRRVGNSNRVMQPREIAEMHFASAGMSWDRLPARNASLEDIDPEKVKRYIKRANSAGRRNISEDEDYLQVLEKLDLINNNRPTWAALLLFGFEPQRFLSQATVHCGRFKSEITVIDDHMIAGTIIDQIDEAMDFVRKNLSVRFVIKDKPQREEVWEYPLDAVREAIINAVCHRDYTIPSKVEIRIYDDRLEVWSPGRLPQGITIEDLYKPHPSVLRNKGIASVFYDMGLIEQWGSGIDRMREACLNAGLPEPEFEEDLGFRVTFRKDIYTEEYLRSLGLNERQIKAVMYLKEKGRITNREYREMFGVSNKTAYLELKDIVEKGVFKVEGRGKKLSYVLNVMKK